VTFRTRLTLLTCAAIALTLLAASIATYSLAKHETYRQVDDALETRIATTRAFQGQNARRIQTQTTGATTPTNATDRDDDPCLHHTGPRIPGNAPGAAGNYTRMLDDHGTEVQPTQPSAACRARQQAQRAQQQLPAQFDEAALPARVRAELRSARVQLPITTAARRLAMSGDATLLHETVTVDGHRYRIVSGRLDAFHVGNQLNRYTVRLPQPVTHHATESRHDSPQ
jgi:hypothetical protein